jgi:organic radical activating enzyme
MPSGEPEIFRSIQGEGVSAGAPSVFLRLATCNLACIWCDTKYTWDWQHYDIKREAMGLSVEDVGRRVTAFGCPRLVITGGEPLLQQDELVPLAASLKRKRFFIEVETNGTIAPSKAMAAAVAQWNVSPKLANSGNRPGRREEPEALRAFARLPNAYWKFVVVERADVDEACALAKRYGVPRERVVLMPEGTTRGVLRERGAWLAQACAESGLRYSPRLHVELWGPRRGR